MRSLLVLIVFLALVLALVVQQHRAAVRIHSLRSELVEAQAILTAYERMHGLLGDRGIHILKTATRVEILCVGQGAGYPRTPTGVDLDKAATDQLSQAILDIDNYSHLDSDDMPVPQAGFRFRGGNASLDILVSLEGSNVNSPHVDLFVFINNEDGASEYRGHACMYSKPLNDLLVSVVASGENLQ
ncbi:hypothetical protein [Singulisphaera acidiphila]|nr:hypothetical protein [Singulisphaera acidiphila]